MVKKKSEKQLPHIIVTEEQRDALKILVIKRGYNMIREVIEYLLERSMKYEELFSLAWEVKQENTPEFMEYWKEEIEKHKEFLKVKEFRIKSNSGEVPE